MTELRQDRVSAAWSAPAPWAAALWDLDGTLVDTEPYWIASEYALAAKYGGTWSDEHAHHLVGWDLLDSASYLREHAGIDREPAEIVEELIDSVLTLLRQRVPFRPGAVELLAAMGAAGWRIGLVTMSYARFLDPILAQLPPGTFEAVVTGDRVSRGKPHPEPYLTAARLLQVAAEDCLAIEDSDTGARSAVAAGCTVLVVPNHVPVPSGERRQFAASLTEVDLDRLVSLRVR